MQKKFFIITILLILIFSIFIGRTLNIMFFKSDYYQERFNSITNIYVEGKCAPRGRILDINGNVIVDNIGTNEIIYHKNSDIDLNMEINIAKRLAKITNYEYKYDINKLKDYYLILKPNDNLITDEEYRLYNERKLSKDDLYNIKIDRITPDKLDSLTIDEVYSSYFYYLMNDGYYYDNKTLLSNIDDLLYAKVLEANLPGIIGETSWARSYPYGDTLKTVLGSISSSLPKEKVDYLSKGYTYLDKVGISGLEEYYEDYLKGTKALYKVNNGMLELVNKPSRGNDLVLEIDINLQKQIEDIQKSEILKAKKLPNTEYFKESFVLVGDPTTGNIKALSGIRLNDNGNFSDISINVIKNAYTVGSVVKAASHTVGYQNKAIDIGTTMTDSCVKLYLNPAKCSFMKLGVLDDVKALAMSSNYYQFITALKVAGYNYSYNMKAPVTKHDFSTYRDTFASFGLGTLTNIDLPNEATGLKGSKVAPDLLLNLAIGQYDLYTPVSLLQYINTVASDGKRLKLNLMHSINSEDEVLLENKPELLNIVNLEDKYFERIKLGLREVIKSGTGYYYANPNIKAAGKTGTSESYIDSNYDGMLDAYVISNTFVMYAPFDNPKYSLVVISPNIANINGKSNYNAPVNRLIARKVNDLGLLGS